jgi:hypothetical protein
MNSLFPEISNPDRIEMVTLKWCFGLSISRTRSEIQYFNLILDLGYHDIRPRQLMVDLPHTDTAYVVYTLLGRATGIGHSV